MVQRIIASIERLSDFPRSGRVVPEHGQDDLREIIVESYRLVYRTRPDLLEIAIVIHGARKMPASAP